MGSDGDGAHRGVERGVASLCGLVDVEQARVLEDELGHVELPVRHRHEDQRPAQPVDHVRHDHPTAQHVEDDVAKPELGRCERLNG